MARGQHCTPRADRTGIAAVREHLPKPERSLITAAFFTGIPPITYDQIINWSDSICISKREKNNRARLKKKSILKNADSCDMIQIVF